MRHRHGPPAQTARVLPAEIRQRFLGTEQDVCPDGETTQPGTGRRRHRCGKDRRTGRTSLHRPRPLERPAIHPRSIQESKQRHQPPDGLPSQGRNSSTGSGMDPGKHPLCFGHLPRARALRHLRRKYHRGCTPVHAREHHRSQNAGGSRQLQHDQCGLPLQPPSGNGAPPHRQAGYHHGHGAHRALPGRRSRCALRPL